MSGLLLKTDDFVPFTTFGDGAAAAIISRVESDTKAGILDVVNYEDMAMIDFLGADRNGNLIMDPRRVKWRAVPNIVSSSKQLMAKAGWEIADVDLMIPHQTGNAIVHSAGEKLGFPQEKVFQEIQYDYGNLSGASVPASLALLKQQGRLKTGMKLITAVTGLGGELGGFSYVVPKAVVFEPKNDDLKGKTAFVTGCTGGLGKEISMQLAAKGCRVIMQYNSNKGKAESLLSDLPNQDLKHEIIKADFSSEDEVNDLISYMKDSFSRINYMVHTVAITGSLGKASEVTADEITSVDKVNYIHPAKITEQLAWLFTDTVLFTGSIAQDAQFSGSSAYVASKRALHGYAASFSKRIYPKVKVIFYIPAIVDGGMTSALNMAQIQGSMQLVGQKELIPVEAIAERMVKSLYITKVANVRNEYHGVMVVRKDGYTKY
jgi:NAD(P)-dependent dehydrogenase (short-subunit alcohol dehydrogenase family)